MVADGFAGRGKAEGGRQERTSGPRDVCAGNADGAADWKSAGARRNRGDAGAAYYFCADHRRDSCRGRRSVDGLFVKRERSATCCRTGEHFGGRDAGEFEDGEGTVHGTCALVAGRFGDGSGFDRAAARGAGDECDWTCSRGFPAGRGAIAGANRGHSSGAEEAAVVARNGGDADVPRRGEPRAPGEERGGPIGGANYARRSGGSIFYEGRETQFECGEFFGSGKSSTRGPAGQPGGWDG